jgi:hypothetical protein
LKNVNERNKLLREKGKCLQGKCFRQQNMQKTKEYTNGDAKCEKGSRAISQKTMYIEQTTKYIVRQWCQK